MLAYFAVCRKISIIKARLVMNKCSYEEIKRINVEDNREIFYLFEEENRITLKECILTSLEIIQTDAKQIAGLKIGQNKLNDEQQ